MISTIYSCMNRNTNLIESLYSWIDCHKYITDTVIVDWSSEKPLIEHKEISNFIDQNKIKLIRVEGEKYFSLSVSYNLAYNNTSSSNNIILKLDSDYKLLDSKWIDRLYIDSRTNELNNYFIVGDHRFAQSLTGFLLINKKHFSYYNENFIGWGYDDLDICKQIKKRHPSIDRVIFFNIKDYIQHIDHTDMERTRYYMIKNKKESNIINKQLSQSKNNRVNINNKFDIIDERSNYTIMKRVCNV